MNETRPTTYVRSIEAEFYALAVTVNRVLTPAEIAQVGGCIGYALRQTLAGEDLSEPERVVIRGGRTTLTYSYDATKSRRDDPDYEGALRLAGRYIQEGTPVRTTNRAGAGTQGTRLVEGIGPCAVLFEVDPGEDPTPTPPAVALTAPDVTELVEAGLALAAAQRRYAEAAIRFAGRLA